MRSCPTGFLGVNRERLKVLLADNLLALAKTGELELIYLHLQSMRNFARLKERLAAVEAGNKAPGRGDANGDTSPETAAN